VIPWQQRALAAAIQAAPVLGIAVWWALLATHSGDYAYMFVYFMPGLLMLATALAVAFVATIAAPRGFVRAHAAGSLRFHGIVVALMLLALVPLFIATFAGGFMGGAHLIVLLSGVVLPLVELGRSVLYGVVAARGEQPVRLLESSGRRGPGE
jgi:hypothetical protein